ncbi:undecaprenyl-diphosphate phosphatase [Phytoactinopolyspora halotolerans]|uniref:Undecaprenyl-diphosphatase n=1 Tax=Phytoactinopolyspora halotolerans TaxID=1981512 RepID=A0A6L9S9Q5_9ACTN|nr:undecaprenyl-diphosphate phosphatase [Phytoactinopolyspora halotolerans]NEE01292.1 undecaprenyl-diphosphate phosphatase [Phytoactinopolyspora halotolerans]
MEWFQAVVLGVLQGLTEFLPISSSAHLRIYPQLFGWEDPGAAFTAVTQIGTETAVILYFIKDIWRIIRAWSLSVFRRGTALEPERAEEMAAAGAGGAAGPRRRRRLARTGAVAPGVYDPAEARMGWYVIIGTIPIVICGITFKDVIEHDFRSLWVVGTTLVVLGIILGISDRVGRKDRMADQLNLRDAVLVGLAQALALVPGVSRSGASISMGLLLGLDRATAARFAFLLAIPAVMGAGIYEWPSAMDEGSVYGMGPTILATVVSFFAGYAVIAWLMRWLERRSFAPFVLYRIALGGLTLLLLATGTLSEFA